MHDPSEVLDPKVQKWLEYGDNMEVFRKARAARLATKKIIIWTELTIYNKRFIAKSTAILM